MFANETISNFVALKIFLLLTARITTGLGQFDLAMTSRKCFQDSTQRLNGHLIGPKSL